MSELGATNLKGYNLRKAELLLEKAWVMAKIYKEKRLQSKKNLYYYNYSLVFHLFQKE